MRPHQVFPIWDDVQWYKVELALVKHVVDPPLGWDLYLVSEGSCGSPNPEGSILKCIQLWGSPVRGNVMQAYPHKVPFFQGQGILLFLIILCLLFLLGLF